MSLAYTLIVIFALISIAKGNKAADEKKKESVRQGKQIIPYYFVFPRKNHIEFFQMISLA